MTNSEKIVRIEKFRVLVLRWSQSEKAEDRSKINREKTWIRQQVIEARCFKSLTIGPPPAIGGLVLEGVDAFEMMFNPPWHMNLVPTVVDMLDATIGVLTAEPEREDEAQKAPSISTSTVPN